MAVRNVKSYGAACDLVTDDLAAIAAAYAACASGDTIYVPAPGCRVATPIGLDDASKQDVTLAGDGPDATTLLCDHIDGLGDGTAVIALGTNNPGDTFSGYTIRGLTAKNAGTTYVQAHAGLGLLHVAGAATVTSLEIADVDLFTRNRVGIELACPVDGYRILRVNVNGSPEEAIYLAGPGCLNGVIECCDLGSQYGPTPGSLAIAVRSADGLRVHHTRIWGNWTHSGISLRADGPFNRDVTIIHCTLEGLAVDAIYVGRGDRVAVLNNRVRLCGGAAVRVVAALDSSAVLVANNRLSRCAGGVLASATGGAAIAGLDVHRNTITECLAGVTIDGPNGAASVTGNTISRRTDSGTSGLYVLNVGESEVSYGGNEVTGYATNPIDAAAIDLDARA
jgi:hypothetical protein